MSEKRFSPVEGMSCLLVGDKGVGLSSVEACDLLNSQAETIEVLREWIQDYHDESNLAAEERGVVFLENYHPNKRVELAKRRIAALEGE